jgi:hypothetical protein
MFVKYTKTLSVRNQHIGESRAFFLLMLANSHTRRASRGSICVSALHCARSFGLGSATAASREKIIASKRANCRLGVCDHDLIAVRCAPPASESGSTRASHARCRHLPFSNSSRL